MDRTERTESKIFDKKAIFLSTLLDKKDEEGLLIPPRRLIEGLIKSEVNLEKLPYFYAEKNRFKDIDQPIRFVKTVDRDNNRVTVQWTVLPHPKYGRPNYFDRDVYRAIQEIINRKGVMHGNLLAFSYREICRIMGLTYSGKTAKDIKDSIRRIRATEVESRGAFQLKGRSKEGEEDEWLTDTFSVFSRIIEKGQRLPDGSKAETGFIELGSWYVQSILRGYLKNLDLQYYFSLSSPLARSFYSYLDVVFHALRDNPGSSFKKRYTEFCAELLVTPQHYKSKVLKIFEPAIDALKATQFLRAFAIEDIPGEKGDWYLIFYPGDRFFYPDRFNPSQESFDFLLPKASRQADKQTKELPAEGMKESASYRLVMYFHERAGRPSWKPKKKEQNQAQNLIDQHGEEKCRAIVDFAFSEAPKTNYQMKFFGAILHFAEQYQVHLEEDFQIRKKREEKKKALHRVKEIKELHEAEVFGKLNARKKELGDGGWKEYVAKGEALALEDNPKLFKLGKSVVERMAEIKADELIILGLGIPSLEDRIRTEGLDPVLLKELDRMR